MLSWLLLNNDCHSLRILIHRVLYCGVHHKNDLCRSYPRDTRCGVHTKDYCVHMVRVLLCGFRDSHHNFHHCDCVHCTLRAHYHDVRNLKKCKLIFFKMFFYYRFQLLKFINTDHYVSLFGIELNIQQAFSGFCVPHHNHHGHNLLCAKRAKNIQTLKLI